MFREILRKNLILLLIFCIFLGCTGKDSSEWNKQGIDFLNKGLHDKAISAFKKAIKINPSNGEAHFHLGRVFKRKGMEAKAETEFSLSFRINPEKFHEYVKKFQEGADYKPDDAQYLHELGNTYVEKAMYDEAIKTFKKVIEIEPDNERAHYKLGMVYSKLSMYNKAADEFRKTIDITPRMPEAHYNLGLVYHKRGMLDAAISEYEATLALFPEITGRKKAGVLYKLGTAYYENKMYDKAIQELQKALEISPKHANAHYQLSTVYKHTGNLKEAEKELENYKKLQKKR